MLKKWSVENFKSVKNRIDLEFAPITIFAGANSSGKSTILHSILLAKQTIRYAPSTRPLALNGPILKLGFFNEVKHSGTTADHIGFGCQFDLTHTSRFGPTASEPRYLRGEFTGLSLESRFTVSGTDEISRLHPQLAYGSLLASYPPAIARQFDGDDDDPEYVEVPRTALQLTIDTPRRAPDPELSSQPAARLDGSDGRPTFSVVQIDEDTALELTEGKVSGHVVGAKADYFVPSEIVVRYDQSRTKANFIAERLCSLTLSSRSRYFEVSSSDRVPPEAIQFLTQYLEQHGFELQKSLLRPDLTEKGMSLSEAVQYLRDSFRPRNSETDALPRTLNMRANSSAQIRATLQDVEVSNRVAEIIAQNYGSSVVAVTEQTTEQLAAVRYIKNFLSLRTKYLGPLRDEPKPLYPLEEIADATDVGYRGEHTAAVLELNRSRWIHYVAPPASDTGLDNFSKDQDYLIGAVTRWLEYLGVASSVSTYDMGKFGHQMQVKTDAQSSSHDLTNVGVGVSQVLPIVVMALLAPSDSLLIFEQPELHLHPRVQSRLADFFLGISLLGKQCVIETHSEYLIQRLRRRIAEEETDILRQDIRAYFVERKDGASSYRPVEFSEYGAIMDWPEDFFDQADRETERLLMAASKKRSRKRSKQL
jgi:predicted ATPase